MIHQDDIKWAFINSLNLANQHHTVLRDNELGVQLEMLTNKTDGGYGCGKTRRFFFIDNDEREFLTVEDMVDAYNEKFKFSEENPEHEVEWVKVVKKKGDKVMISIKPNQGENPNRSVATEATSTNHKPAS